MVRKIAVLENGEPTLYPRDKQHKIHIRKCVRYQNHIIQTRSSGKSKCLFSLHYKSSIGYDTQKKTVCMRKEVNKTTEFERL
jgi:hypothetical protein